MHAQSPDSLNFGPGDPATAVAVSVIVPARDAQQTLGACLEALRREGIPGPSMELLVVDDGSTDRTEHIAGQTGARVLSGYGRGPAAARNIGVQAARGQILIFLDADTAPRPGWLEAMLAPFADPGVVAVKGRYFTHQRGLVARFSQVEFEEKYTRLERARHVDFVDTGTAAFRRDAFLAAGGFNEHLRCAEDVELAYRMATSGAQFVFAADAGVDHRHAEQLHQYFIKKARFGFFRLKVYRRFPRKALGDAYTPPLMGAQIGIVGLASVLLLLVVLGVPWAGPGIGLALTTFVATTLPLVVRARARDGVLLAMSVPCLSLARSLAQGLGILLAVLSELAEWLKLRPQAGADRRLPPHITSLPTIKHPSVAS